MLSVSISLSILLFILNYISVHCSSKKLNNYPIIGVFTQPSSSKRGNCNGKCLYLAASYVKYLESAGARVVPINYYASNSELDEILSQVNGVFLPGGGAKFPSSAQYVYDKIKKMNDDGDYFPLWGSCLGFEWLLIAQSKDSNILDPPSGQLDSYNLSIPLDFTNTYLKSKIFKSAPKTIIKTLSSANVTLNNHHYGIFPRHFEETDALESFFNVLSTNKDRQGVEFVSMIEAYDYPIFGCQWHPEKNPFEFSMTSDGIPLEAINHDPFAIIAAQYFADFFVGQTRLNKHKYKSPDEEDAALIYNYQPTKGISFVQIYYFNW